MSKLDEWRRKLDVKLAEKNHLEKTVLEEKEALSQNKRDWQDTQRGQALVQSVAETVQNDAVSQIAGVVDRALELVFGEEAYSFSIKFVQRRGKTEADLCFVNSNGHEIDPTTASGGGVCDLVSFALRLACLVLTRPQRRKFIALDEPFKHLSSDRTEAVRNMLLTLSEELDVQWLLVTHNTKLQAGKVVEIGS